MNKILLLRIYAEGVKGLYSDGLEIQELEKIISWCQDCISNINAMKPKEEKNKT